MKTIKVDKHAGRRPAVTVMLLRHADLMSLASARGH